MVKSSKIYLRNVRFHAYHGVLEQENTVGNDYLINLSLEYDFTRAMQTDELSGTINYAEVYELLKREMAKPSKLLSMWQEESANRSSQPIPLSGRFNCLLLRLIRRWEPIVTVLEWKLY